MKKLFHLLGIVLIVTLLIGGGLSGLEAVKQVGAQANVPCYGEQGGAKHVAGSSCEYEFQSGSTLDMQSGSTTNLGGSLINSGGSVTVGDNLVVTGTSDLQGNVSDSSGSLTIADNSVVTGTLNVSDTLTAAASDFNGAMNVDANIDADSISVAGNADLTTINNSGGDLDINDNVDITGTLQYGADNLYPLGVSSSGFQAVWGSEIITGAIVITHNLTSPVWADCEMGQAPSAVAGESFDCYVLISGAVVTVTTISSDTIDATTGATVYWEVKGTP